MWLLSFYCQNNCQKSQQCRFKDYRIKVGTFWKDPSGNTDPFLNFRKPLAQIENSSCDRVTRRSQSTKPNKNRHNEATTNTNNDSATRSQCQKKDKDSNSSRVTRQSRKDRFLFWKSNSGGNKCKVKEPSKSAEGRSKINLVKIHNRHPKPLAMERVQNSVIG